MIGPILHQILPEPAQRSVLGFSSSTIGLHGGLNRQISTCPLRHVTLAVNLFEPGAGRQEQEL